LLSGSRRGHTLEKAEEFTTNQSLKGKKSLIKGKLEFWSGTMTWFSQEEGGSDDGITN